MERQLPGVPPTREPPRSVSLQSDESRAAAGVPGRAAGGIPEPGVSRARGRARVPAPEPPSAQKGVGDGRRAEAADVVRARAGNVGCRRDEPDRAFAARPRTAQADHARPRECVRYEL